MNPDAEVKELQAENRELIDKLKGFSAKFEDFESALNKLSETDNDLRLATNLDPIQDEDRELGTGGSVFEDLSLTNPDNINEVISRINYQVDNISLSLNFEKNNYEEIKNQLEINKQLYDAIPAIKPSEGRYGDKFGMRYHPILKIRRMHYGIDMLANTGTSVYAPGSGVVEFASRKGGHGNTLIIDHGFGYKTLYSHLSKFKVKKGQKINRGDLIALTGSSGRLATGPHLHYEVTHNGIALDPRNFIFDDVTIFDIKPELLEQSEE